MRSWGVFLGALTSAILIVAALAVASLPLLLLLAAGRRWRVEVTRTATDDPDLIAVEIAVSREGGASSLARLSGFVDAEASA